jgi:hypothetical protein
MYLHCSKVRRGSPLGDNRCDPDVVAKCYFVIRYVSFITFDVQRQLNANSTHPLSVSGHVYKWRIIPAVDWRDGWRSINPAGGHNKHEAQASCSSAPAAYSSKNYSTAVLGQCLRRFARMADMDSPAISREQNTSSSPQTASNTAQSPSAEEVVPLFDIINTCLEELPVLREATSCRCARACLVSDGGLENDSSSPDQPTSLLSELDNLSHKEHAVLIIEDIDAVCFHALTTRFPASLDVRFLAQHVLRLGELKATYDFYDSLCDEYRTLVSRVDAEIWRRLPDTTVNRDHQCQHIDGFFRRYGTDIGPLQMTAPEVDGYRLEGFCR